MRFPSRSAVLFAALGAVAFLVFHLQLVLLWSSYYSHYPWPGYDGAMAAGRVAPFFTTTTRGVELAQLFLCVLPLAALPFAGRRADALLAIWGGVMVAAVGAWVATPLLRQDSDMWPIDLVFLGGYTGFPLLVGGLIFAVVHRVGRGKTPLPSGAQ